MVEKYRVDRKQQHTYISTIAYFIQIELFRKLFNMERSSDNLFYKVLGEDKDGNKGGKPGKQESIVSVGVTEVIHCELDEETERNDLHKEQRDGKPSHKLPAVAINLDVFVGDGEPGKFHEPILEGHPGHRHEGKADDKYDGRPIGTHCRTFMKGNIRHHAAKILIFQRFHLLSIN